jgi:predicted Fe-Mo cluster-binding NifX family protein
MKEVSAVQSIEGIQSKVYNHFGWAPALIIVETDEKDVWT